MNKTTDWKAKYQAAIGELEDKESEWESLDKILRKTIGRLSIAGRGHDKKLDEQLKLIQNLSRKKRDAQLPDAIEKLTMIVATVGNADDAPSENQNAGTVSVLSELLKKLKLNPEQQSELEKIGSDLLQSVSGDQGTDQINRQLSRLTTLINKNFPAQKGGEQGAEIISQFVRLLAIDEGGQKQIDQQLQSSKSITDRELKKLANIINAQIDSNGNQGDSITAAITSLLVKLSAVEGSHFSTIKIQSRINDGIKEDQWQDILEEVATAISQTLDRLGDEKHQLESLIFKITEQFGELTQFITENYLDHLSDHQETLSMQKLMHEGVAKIEENIKSSQNIGQLKSVVTSNIHLIREGVENFVDRANSRHEAVESRNGKLTRQISKMEKEANQLKKRLKESSNKLLHDTLTGMGSRLAYDEQIKQELARSSRYGSSLSYAILDIDHFKRINDKYGHSAGDKALKLIGQLMTKQIRKSDYIYRIGGEEFVILITNTKLSKAEALVQKIRKAVVDSGFHFRQERVDLTLSAGITEAQKGDKIQTIYDRADSALYRAKNSGRNCQFVA